MKTYNIDDLIQAARDTIAQGYSCKNVQGYCVYNHSNGVDHCIIGHMIKDDERAQSVINRDDYCASGVFTLVKDETIAICSKLNIDMFVEMQYTHDSPLTWERGIESAFNAILNKYGYSL
jgi:hypothetical protein